MLHKVCIWIGLIPLFTLQVVTLAHAREDSLEVFVSEVEAVFEFCVEPVIARRAEATTGMISRVSGLRPIAEEFAVEHLRSIQRGETARDSYPCGFSILVNLGGTADYLNRISICEAENCSDKDVRRLVHHLENIVMGMRVIIKQCRAEF
jgi:hypothetical protein